jgi:hypothetical protein
LLAVGGCMALLLGFQQLQFTGTLASQAAERARNFLLAASLAMSLAISSRVAFVVAAMWGVLFLLNEPPLNLRRAPLLRNLLESMALCCVALLGFVALGGPMVGFPIDWLIPMLLAQMLGGLFTDLIPGKDSAIPWYDAWGSLRVGPVQAAYRWMVALCFVAAQCAMAILFLRGFAWVGVLLWSGLMAGWMIWGNAKRVQTAWLRWAALPIYIALAIVASR